MRKRRTLRLVGGALSAGLVLCSAPLATATAAGATPTAGTLGTAPSWGHAADLSKPGGLGTYPVVGLDAAGDAVAVWAELVGTHGQYRIDTANRYAKSSAWSQPVALSRRNLFADFPQLAVNADGAAVAAWDAGGESNGTKRPPDPTIGVAVRRSAAGRWSRVHALGTPSTFPYDATAAIDAKGDATVAWVSSAGVQASTLPFGSHTWSAPVTLATVPSNSVASALQLASNAAGEVVAVWDDYLSGGVLTGETNAVMAAVRPAGSGTWRRATELGIETNAPFQGVAAFEIPGPRVALDAAGDAVCVFQAKVKSNIVIDATVRPVATGSWQAASPISGTAGLTASVAMDGAGDMTAIWAGSGSRVVVTSSRTLTGAWSKPRTLTAVESGGDAYPQILMSPGGATLALWDGASIEARTRHSATGVWSRPAALGDGAVVQGAISSAGRVIATWQVPTSHPSGIEVMASIGQV